VRYGAIAEFALAAPAYTIRLPDSMSFAEGAALYANYTTAWFALYRARVQHGEWVLVRGAAGGVGTAALQIIKAAEARSIALVSSDAKRRAAAAMGADEVLVTSEPWRAEIGALTGGTGVAVVLDPVGGDGLRDCLMTMAVAGRAVIIGFASGAISVIDVGLLKDRNLTMIGISMDIYEQRHAGTISDVNRAVQALAERAAVKPVISRRLPLEGGADALKMLERRDAIGKIVVDVRP
jgi:NADPH2:quinone reductase